MHVRADLVDDELPEDFRPQTDRVVRIVGREERVIEQALDAATVLVCGVDLAAAAVDHRARVVAGRPLVGPFVDQAAEAVIVVALVELLVRERDVGEGDDETVSRRQTVRAFKLDRGSGRHLSILSETRNITDYQNRQGSDSEL
ncbi:MAG: hypothetical protein A3D44_02275 [Candidatus Staskawiczbacteria bacterium RIFCSPHIGHO2_02_FULL_42_22]|uniref:Uncharacterized protein n=1 Tax=Candidatus Staskawiczbacteria bacterium RIFCSPHIGHO2_02_FULL_42_22 TaxID=1802207 RepID=A0A1G2I2Z4_9BACT|nr:MAG: hypothetical protein A3D44_02275 [Candidatus Staskawiczbacteria bacterium RIFCSPHIGHO2_02_FULL_42_22]